MRGSFFIIILISVLWGCTARVEDESKVTTTCEEKRELKGPAFKNKGIAENSVACDTVLQTQNPELKGPEYKLQKEIVPTNKPVLSPEVDQSKGPEYKNRKIGT